VGPVQVHSKKRLAIDRAGGIGMSRISRSKAETWAGEDGMVYCPMAILLDPISPDPHWQANRERAWWEVLQPRMPRPASKYGPEKPISGLAEALRLLDWGTAEKPGESLWALRTLVAMREPLPGMAVLGDFLKSQPKKNLPPLTMDLWGKAWRRQVYLITAMQDAPEGHPEAEAIQAVRAQLFTQVVRHWPQLLVWLCQSREVLVGKDPQGVAYGGEHWKSPLSKAFARPRPGEGVFRAGVLEQLLDLDPMKGLEPKVRQDTYGVLVGKHPRLRTAVLGEAQLETAQVEQVYQNGDARTSQLLHLLAQRSDVEALARLAAEEGFDPMVRDAYGQTLLHATIQGLSTKRKATTQDIERGAPTDFVDVEPAVMEQKLQRLMQTWAFLVKLGIDENAVSAPAVLPRMSPKTHRPVRTLKWPPKVALPGETPFAQVQRLVGDGKFQDWHLTLFQKHLALFQQQTILDRAQALAMEAAAQPARPTRSSPRPRG
jgi:hypothetical protein